MLPKQVVDYENLPISDITESGTPAELDILYEVKSKGVTLQLTPSYKLAKNVLFSCKTGELYKIIKDKKFLIERN